MSEARPSNFLNDGSKSTQDAYYDWMLRKEKLASLTAKAKTDGWLVNEEVAALEEVGEKEKLELKILARVSGLADSSPELLQLKALTDCKSREEIARSLADVYYRKITTEEVLNKYVAPSSAKTNIFGKSATKSAENYKFWSTSSNQ